MPDMVETMAYSYKRTSDVPWHGNGFPITNDMTVDEWMETSGANYEVHVAPSFVSIEGIQYPTGDNMLYRVNNGKVQKLDNVSKDWIPNQNKVAFDFIREEVEAGDMVVETAGVLDNGRYAWVLARLKDGAFELGGKDINVPYFGFFNPHKYGHSITTCFTPIRWVCMNTIMLGISKALRDQIIRTNHRNEFVASDVKKKLIFAKRTMGLYKEKAEFLFSKRATDAAAREFFRTLLPMVTKDDEKKVTELSKGAQVCMDLLHTQPGVELCDGSWWNTFQGFTHYADHKAGKEATTVDTRLTNAWFGVMKTKKEEALRLALDMASKSADMVTA